MSRMDAECERLTIQGSKLKGELDIALCFVEDTGIDIASIHNTETLKAKEQVHRLSSNLNRLKGDYAVLLEELTTTRGQFLDAREETSKQHELQMNKLSQRVIVLEEALEQAQFEQNDLSNKLQVARRKQANSINDSETISKKEMQDDLISAKAKVSELEAKLMDSRNAIKNLQKEVKQCKDALSSSRMENKKLEEEFERMKTNRSIRSRSTDDEESYGIPDFPLRTKSSRLSETPTEQTSQMETENLRSTLDEVKLENELLKDRLVRMSGGQFELSSTEQVDMLKKKLVGKSKELRAAEEKLSKTKSLLRDTENKLKEKEDETERSEEECSELKSEVAALKDALHEARQDHSDALHQVERMKKHSIGLQEAMEDEKLEKLSTEKSSLQHQLDDAKIALSVSEYAQERTKEELKICQTKLGSSQTNLRTLKEEMKKLATAFKELKTDHAKLLLEYESSLQCGKGRDNDGGDDSKAKKGLERLTKQLDDLATENANLQELVTELETKVASSNEEVETKNREIETLECKLLTTQDEARLLSEEITNLSNAFENAKAEYDSVVEELDSVQSLFDKSRDEAGRYGKESASQDLPMKLERSDIIPSTALDDARAAIEAESAAKVNSLKYQVEALTIENVSMQGRIRKLSSKKEDMTSNTGPVIIATEQADQTGSLRAELRRLSDENAELLNQVETPNSTPTPRQVQESNVIPGDDQDNSTMNVLEKISSLVSFC